MEDSEIEQIFSKLNIKEFRQKYDRHSYNERKGNTSDGGGPLGLGDPRDQSLNHYEKMELIPQRMFAITNTYSCGAFR